MIVNAAIFTCSICGEVSSNICAYCTKDACANHRCERCKRCSDCCECEYPLSAEEPATPELVAAAVVEPGVVEPEVGEPEVVEPEVAALEAPELEAEPLQPEALPAMPGFLTREESSVFVAGSVPTEFMDWTEPSESTDPDESGDPPAHDGSAEPRE